MCMPAAQTITVCAWESRQISSGYLSCRLDSLALSHHSGRRLSTYSRKKQMLGSAGVVSGVNQELLRLLNGEVQQQMSARHGSDSDRLLRQNAFPTVLRLAQAMRHDALCIVGALLNYVAQDCLEGQCTELRVSGAGDKDYCCCTASIGCTRVQSSAVKIACSITGLKEVW